MEFISIHAPKFPTRVYSSHINLSAEQVQKYCENMNLNLHGAVGHWSGDSFFGSFIFMDEKRELFKFAIVNTFCKDRSTEVGGTFVPYTAPLSLMQKIGLFNPIKRCSLLIQHTTA